jgi:3',5'-cyclic AMP phosphodiesterase CpdA
VPRRLATMALACAAVLAPPAWAAGPAAPSAPAGVTVYAAGDIARCASPDPAWSGAAATAATVEAGLAADPGAIVLTLGDHTYPRGAAREFTDCYGPTWGRFKARTWPAPGNHEYYTPDAAPYFAYFGARAASGWYSLDAGGWHIISLDSDLTPEHHAARYAAQIAWLRADLAAHPARCTLAFWHHPLYSSGGHGSVATMKQAWQLLYDAGAELVLSGHDHDYERFAPQDADGRLEPARGIRQFVVGTGGAYPTPFLRTVPNSEMRDNGRTGVLRLRLRDGGYEWEFLESGRVTTLELAPADHGTGACH